MTMDPGIWRYRVKNVPSNISTITMKAFVFGQLQSQKSGKADIPLGEINSYLAGEFNTVLNPQEDVTAKRDTNNLQTRQKTSQIQKETASSDESQRLTVEIRSPSSPEQFAGIVPFMIFRGSLLKFQHSDHLETSAKDGKTYNALPPTNKPHSSAVLTSIAVSSWTDKVLLTCTVNSNLLSETKCNCISVPYI